MAEQAKVTRIEALETFRSHLILFVHQAHRSVDEVGDDVRRMRAWVQMEQRPHWEREIRRRQKLLDSAQQELMGVKMSNLRDNTRPYEQAVRKCREALHEAEEKLRNVKTWIRDFDHQIEGRAKKLQALRDFLTFDMPKAVAFLVQAQMTLTDYAEMRSTPSALAPATEPSEAQ